MKSLEGKGHEKSLEAHLQSQKMEALGTMASGIAHDFNNILQGLYNALFALEEDVADREETMDKLEVAYSLADQAKELVQQILTYSRQQEGDFKVFSPLSAIQDIVEIARISHKPQIPINLIIDSPQVFIYGDEIQIKQVLLNLITNAFQAMDHTEKPMLKIQVSTKTLTNQRKQYLCIEVIDNGHGIGEKNQQRIFEPFYTTKEIGSGSGLGLSVVHGIVAKHGGHIELESKVGRYTMFQIFLPIRDANDQGQKVNSLIYRGKEDVVLAVQDSEPFMNFSKILEGLGHKVSVVQTAQETYEIVKANRHNRDQVLIIGHKLPDFSTTELVRKVRQFHPNIPILVVKDRDHQKLPDSLSIIFVDDKVIQFSEEELTRYLHSFSLPS